MKPASPEGITINSLVERTGHHRSTLLLWFGKAGLKKIPGTARYLEADCDRVIAEHLAAPKTDSQSNPVFEEVVERVKKLKRENRIAEMMESGQYMLRSRHQQILGMVISKLELIPPKLQSEFALEVKVMNKLTLLHDEARAEASKEVVETS